MGQLLLNAAPINELGRGIYSPLMKWQRIQKGKKKNKKQLTCVYEDVENGLPEEKQGSREKKRNKTKHKGVCGKVSKLCSLQWVEKIELILGNPGEWAEGAGEDRGESGPVTTAGLLPGPARRAPENEEPTS